MCTSLCTFTTSLYIVSTDTLIFTHIILGLPDSHEYFAAMELEMWKLSQEQMFNVKMKGKEAEYLNKLGEEWEKKEEERQNILTDKVRRVKCNRLLCPWMLYI